MHVTKTKNELDKLDDDSTDIYKSNVIERYSLRPNSIPAVDKLCLAQFAVFYYRDYRTDYDDTKDSPPDVLNDDLLESHNSTEDAEQGLPSKIKLMNKNEYMKCRKVKAVLRYHTPNKTKEPELYFFFFYYKGLLRNTLLAPKGELQYAYRNIIKSKYQIV